MAGNFEVFVDKDSLYRFRLLAADGTVMAVSSPYQDKAAVAAGIAAVRECAGTGLVTDLSLAAVPPAAPAARPGAMAGQDCADRHGVARTHTFTLAKGARRLAGTARWTSAVAR